MACRFLLPIVVATAWLASACGSDSDSPAGTSNVGGSGAGAHGGSGGVAGSGAQGGTAGASPTGGAGGAPGALCPSPLPSSWIFCDDFESAGAVADRYFEYDDNGGDFVPVSSEAHSGSHSMQVSWQQGEVGAGALHVTFGRNPLGSVVRPDEDFGEIYWRVYLLNQPGWVGSPDKLTRATAFAAADWSQAMIAHLWSSGDVLMGDPASCVSGSTVQCVGYNDFAHLSWLGQMPGVTPLFATEAAGVWRCVEGHVRLNTPGASDGVFEFWIDGQLEAARSDLDWRGSWQDYGINAAFFENYWNAGSPVEQKRYFDDIAIAVEPLGCP
jgi:hypothetical protein